MDSAVHRLYKEATDNKLTSQDKALLKNGASSGKDSNLQAEKIAGDTPCQQATGTATVIDSVSGQANPNIIQ